MVKYFFFEVKVETNESSQLRKVFYPLPGQTTYVDRSHPNDPVHTDWRLQLTLLPNGLACRCAVDSIIGVKLESSDPRELKLNIRTRNARKFYQTDAPIFFVAPGESMVLGLVNGDEEMLAAYRALLGSGSVDMAPEAESQHNDERPETTRTCVRDSHSLTALCQDPISFGVITEVVASRNNELRVIEDFLVQNESETRAVNLTLNISMLMDRMQKGVAKFSYFKQNGDYREAYGTRNRDLIDFILVSEGSDRYNSVHDRENSVPDGEHFRYFDIQQKDWRCFCVKDFDELQQDFLIMSAVETRALSGTVVNAS